MRSDDLRAVWRRERFEWGRTDCIMSVCNYVRDQTGIDPALPWRGSYSDEAGAVAICGAHGGVLGLMRHGMALAGIAVGQRYEGAPVVALIGGQEIAGVDLGARIGVMAAGRGMIEMRAQVLEAWII